jgi:tRNA dimethylallyltransferase
MNKKIIVILGPTGVGKTKLSIELAKKFNGEIINADSMQIYKGLNIGTAKIKEEEKENITHHLFDIKDVTDEYSVYEYQMDAREVIDEIQNKNKTVIIVGGTGLYIKSALYDYKFENDSIKSNYENLTTEELYKKLISYDKDIKIDKNNRRRLIRAINYYLNNNESINSNNNGDKLLYDVIFIGLTIDRENLYNIINNRVDKMISGGLIEEVKCFYDKKICSKALINGIGYKELYKYFNNEITLEDAINLIKTNSRRYAKRQYTFFNNKFKDIKWFDVNFNNFNKTINDVSEYIKNISEN